MTDDTPQTFIVAEGGPNAGFRLMGPFGSEAQAAEFAHERSENNDSECWVMPVHAPEKE